MSCLSEQEFRRWDSHSKGPVIGGAVHWLGPLVDCMFDGTSESTHYITRTMVGARQYHRFQIYVDPRLASMDNVDTANLEQLRGAGARAVDEQKEAISIVVSALTASTQAVP